MLFNTSLGEFAVDPLRTASVMGVLPDWRLLVLALRRVLLTWLVGLRLELERELLEAASGVRCDFIRATA